MTGEFFRDGGMFMYLTALFGFLLAGASWSTLARPQRYWRVTALLALLTGASGMLGTLAGLIATFRSALCPLRSTALGTSPR
jgi:hypothetical protein